MRQTMPEILERLSSELVRLTELASSLQDHFSPAAHECIDMEGLQSLDLLHQTLACLSTFTARIVAASPGHPTIDTQPALEGITLAALARRLDGRQPVAADHDIELF